MASHKSALKAHKQSLVRRAANRAYRSRLRTALKDIRTALTEGRADDVKASLSETVSLIDKMAGKGIIHDNAAARYKSRIVRRYSALSTSPSA